jgi:hypothetical protein
MFSKKAPVDNAIENPLSNILWAAPLLAQEIPEMAQITQIFKKSLGLE